MSDDLLSEVQEFLKDPQGYTPPPEATKRTPEIERALAKLEVRIDDLRLEMLLLASLDLHQSWHGCAPNALVKAVTWITCFEKIRSRLNDVIEAVESGFGPLSQDQLRSIMNEGSDIREEHR